MMRKWMAVLLLAGLITSTACCSRAFDFSPYVIGANEILLEYEVKRRHTSSVEWDGKGQDLVVFNGDGKLLCRQALGIKSRYDAAVTADHPQGGCMIVLVKWGAGNADKVMQLRRIDEKGNMLWDCSIPKGFSYNWDILCDDGQGGVFFAFADPDNYKLAQVWHWDVQGNVLWNKVIEAEDLIFDRFSGRFDAQKDRLVIGGHVGSKSRGIYDVVVLEIDREGNMETVSSKDFSCRPDYSFDVLMDEDGVFFAHSRADYLDTNGTPRVLVPIDALPDAPKRTILLRDEQMPKTYYYNADGGRKYHVQERCGSIDAKYYDSIRKFDAPQLSKPPYNGLDPCGYCRADK